MSICCCWLDIMFQPRSSMCATRKIHCLMIIAGMLLASSRRIIFDGSLNALGLALKSLSAVKRELIMPAQQPNISLVSETGMLL